MSFSILFRAYWQRPAFIAAWVFALALALRLIFAAQWHATPYGASPLLDAQAYDLWAQEIAKGHWLRDRAFYQLPLFPYLLGILYAVFRHSLWVGSLFNAFIGAATCALLADIAFVCFGAAAAMATGLLSACYAPFIFYTAPVMKEPLGLFLLAASLALACRAIKSEKRTAFLWSGIALGLCALVRGNVLALAPVLPLQLWIMHRTARVKNSAVFFLGILLAILPATLHNIYVSHDFVLISYADGFNAYIGHGPMATGTSYVFPPGVTSNPAREEYDITRIASAAAGQDNMTPSQVSAYWRKLAFDYAVAHPAHEMQLLTAKIMAFWNDAEPFDNYDMRFIEQNFTTLLAWPLPGFGLIFALSAFALLATPRPKRGAVIVLTGLSLAYMVTLFPFYVTDRYRLPVTVFLLPLAGACIPALKQLIGKQDFRRIAFGLFASFLALLIAFWPGSEARPDDAYDWSMLSTLEEEQGHDRAAFDDFIKANRIDPTKVGADAWIETAQALAHLGHPQDGAAMLAKAQLIIPNDGSVTYNLGREKFLAGDYDAAGGYFWKSIEQLPTFTLSYRGLAAVYDHQGKQVLALDALQRGLAIVPNDPLLLEARGQIEAEKPRKN